MSLDAMLFKEAIADAKARRQTELAWCKCPEDCLCDHCKPMKTRLAIIQAKEKLEESFDEKKFLTELERGKYQMRNQTHTLSEETLNTIIKIIQ